LTSKELNREKAMNEDAALKRSLANGTPPTVPEPTLIHQPIEIEFKYNVVTFGLNQ